MNVLLDTQALLWFLLDDSRLSGSARERVVSTSTLIFVSPASLWEIAIKISLGKYTLPEPFLSFWERQMEINDFTFLPISIAQTAMIVSLPFHHRDPFDRLIIAQALVEGIPVVSSDSIFDRYGVERIW
jgi:PIN domain nuclease of toxin-antitoxin system